MSLDTYAPLKKNNKDKLRFKSKPWITPGFQKMDKYFEKNGIILRTHGKESNLLFL